MLPATREILDAYWLKTFGCDATDLPQGKTIVVPHGSTLTDYTSAFIFEHDSSCVVSVPTSALGKARHAFQNRAADDAFNSDTLELAFGPRIEVTIGPAWIGYADTADARPANPEGVRVLTPQDEVALGLLEAACPRTEWEHSAIDRTESPLFGCFQDDVLVAAGTCPTRGAIFRDRGAAIRHIGIVTHPAHRGQGFGRRVVRVMTAYGLAEQRIVGYRTLLTNVPSLRIAQSLGYEAYALTLAVRLKT